MKPTRKDLLKAYATLSKTNVNTGLKNKKGRTIFQGPRGGRFVRVKGRKVYKV